MLLRAFDRSGGSNSVLSPASVGELLMAPPVDTAASSERRSSPPPCGTRRDALRADSDAVVTIDVAVPIPDAPDASSAPVSQVASYVIERAVPLPEGSY